MWSFKHFDAFISYSHNDGDMVKPLVELLSVNQRRVFWDRDLKAGDLWDTAIRSSIEQSNVFVLFWCCDGCVSEYIAKEIGLAVSLKKKIVPVRLCDQPVPSSLEVWQWIDLRHRVEHRCTDRNHSLKPPDISPAKEDGHGSIRRRAIVICLVAALAVIVSTKLLVRRPLYIESLPPPVMIAGLQLSAVEVCDPKTAIHLRDGYAIVYPPHDGQAGTIIEFNDECKMIDEYSIPSRTPPIVLPVPEEVPLPWWYVNRYRILAGLARLGVALIALAAAFIIVARRRRARNTLDITLKYLRGLSESG